MNYIFNRLLYSLFFWKKFIYNSFHYFFKKPMMILCKLLFRWDPFNYLQNQYETAEEYYKYIYSILDTFANDIDWGDHITDGIGVLAGGTLAYIFLLLAYIKYLMLGDCHCFVNEVVDFNINIIISMIVSQIIIYITITKKDKYKKYFERFETDERERKGNKIWHCIAALYYIGIFVAMLLGVVYS